ncbi:carboxymuconolactone decarboxylase family protein [Phytohabitans houttuyneae]|uniref:Alkyl hydroperoxide reductase AhpD n=1 Tax=Phytohabitans houttuyneae TaxID=1076126 RepID=A0A6V8KSB6_9ACTN|nr:carboxymuconolactone decarboxylase family protein [Phytohabitans houttuyneae]GFJ85251.1 alkyl hydroperoxide reductase AhpD [Phytohabitans houttuyneae]
MRRINLQEVAPEGFEHVRRLEGYIQRRLDKKLLFLVKLRASFINGCAYCVDMHSQHAIEAGESTRRLFAVATWREVDLFDERERAALALTDSVTRLGEGGVPDDVWDTAAKVYTEEELADLLLAIVTINMWNRIAIPSRNPLPA